MLRKEFRGPGSAGATDLAFQWLSDQVRGPAHCRLRSRMQPPQEGPQLAAESAAGLALQPASVLRAQESAPAEEALALLQAREWAQRAQAEEAVALALAPALASSQARAAVVLGPGRGPEQVPLPPEEDATRLLPATVRAQQLEPAPAPESPPGSAEEVQELEQEREPASALLLAPAAGPKLAREQALEREPRLARARAAEVAPASELPARAPAPLLELAPVPVHHPVTARVPWPPPVLQRPSPPKAFHVAA